MKAIEVNNLSKEYKYKVKDENKGFFYNLFYHGRLFYGQKNGANFRQKSGVFGRCGFNLNRF